jgi:hypothetical protein
LILAICTASSNPVQPDFVEGHLKILSLREVEPPDAMPRPTVTVEAHAGYPLIILSADKIKKSRALMRTKMETIALCYHRAIMF